MRLTVRDDGVGRPAAARELEAGGIRSLRERALSIDARLRVAEAPGQGTEVELRVPGEA